MKKFARLRVAQDDQFMPPGIKINDNINVESKNIRTTGRIKKPKAVFDPSDNYTPRAQRSNVTTTQSLTTSPKTATARNVRERSSSTGSNGSTASNSQNDICIVCSKREPRRGGNFRNRLFPCIDCNKRVHKMCMSIDFYEAAPLRLNYRCENCRTCEICSKGQSDLITCAKCCKSYHLTCLAPKVTQYQQSQRWKCFKCIPNTSLSASNGKEESMPVMIIRQIIGDDTNLKLQNSHLSQPQTTPKKEEKDCDKSQKEETNNVKTKKESTLRGKRSSSTDLPENNDYDSDDESDEDFVYIEKKKRKMNPHPEYNKSNGSNCTLGLKAEDKPKTEVVSKQSIELPKREVVRTWSVEQVTEYIEKYFRNEARVFKEQEIDGNALLLLKRSDIVQKLPLKLGPSLRLYNFILRIQTQVGNDPTLGWDCCNDSFLPSTE